VSRSSHGDFSLETGNETEIQSRFERSLREKAEVAKEAVQRQRLLVADMTDRAMQELRYQVQWRILLNEYMHDVEEKRNTFEWLQDCIRCDTVRRTTLVGIRGAERRMEDAQKCMADSEARSRELEEQVIQKKTKQDFMEKFIGGLDARVHAVALKLEAELGQ
jgi:hypothetical protein